MSASLALQLTNVHDPAEADRADQPAIPEALNPQGEREAPPCPHEVLRCLPEEYCYTAACNAGNTTREHEETAKAFTRGIDRIEDAKLENQDEACEGERIEADEEKGRPPVLVAEECARETGEDEQGA